VKKFIDEQPDNRITGKTFKGGGILQVQGEQNPNSGEKTWRLIRSWQRNTGNNTGCLA
jgi:hypothetical protein